MLSSRTETILRFIVEEYINKATPVPSQDIVDDYALGVSSATIRNEMANLEREGYIIRPYPSAGSVPSDKGYRFYVERLGDVALPLAEQRLINHLFHQVEKELEESLHLSATLISQMVHNIALATMPKQADCRLKHLELVPVQESLVLLVLVLHGAKIRQKLITFEQPVPQAKLATIANKLNTGYSSLAGSQIQAKSKDLPPEEKQVIDWVVKIMTAEDEQKYDEPHLHGLHYMLNQPEFAQGARLLDLMELVEHGKLLTTILPQQIKQRGVQIIIGKENQSEAVQGYSIILSRYGLPGKVIGTIGAIGPTRMPYARAIAIVTFLSSTLSELVAELYEGGSRQRKAR